MARDSHSFKFWILKICKAPSFKETFRRLWSGTCFDFFTQKVKYRIKYPGWIHCREIFEKRKLSKKKKKSIKSNVLIFICHISAHCILQNRSKDILLVKITYPLINNKCYYNHIFFKFMIKWAAKHQNKCVSIVGICIWISQR